jgi:hypothetical protein
VPNVQWKTPDDGQRNCPKHVEFLDKNKFGKLVRLLVLLKIHFIKRSICRLPVTVSRSPRDIEATQGEVGEYWPETQNEEMNQAPLPLCTGVLIIP